MCLRGIYLVEKRAMDLSLCSEQNWILFNIFFEIQYITAQLLPVMFWHRDVHVEHITATFSGAAEPILKGVGQIIEAAQFMFKKIKAYHASLRRPKMSTAEKWGLKPSIP